MDEPKAGAGEVQDAPGICSVSETKDVVKKRWTYVKNIEASLKGLSLANSGTI